MAKTSVTPSENGTSAHHHNGHSTPQLSAVDDITIQQIANERLLAGGVYLFSSEARAALDRARFDPACIRDEGLRKYLTLCMEDDADPEDIAFKMDIALELLDYSEGVENAERVTKLAAKLMGMHRRKKNINLASQVATAAMTEDRAAEIEAVAALAGNALEDEEGEGVLLTAPADHDGHAQALLALYPKRFIYVEEWGWLYYTGTHWSMEGAGQQAKDAVIKTLRKRRVEAARIEKMELVRASRNNNGNIVGTLYLLEPKVSATTGEFDNHPDLLNCKNGVVNLKTGELTPHDPAQRFTYCLPVDYDPQADRSVWLDFLKQTVSNDSQMLDYLQAAVGYSLTGHTWEEVMFYLYGPSRSGKGTFTEVILAMLGRPLAREADITTFTSARVGDTQNFDLAPLKACRFVAAAEAGRTSPLNSEKIKAITGRNQIRCAYKHKDLFEYQPSFKIWLSSNFPVNLDVDDSAAWGRVRLIEFPNSHLGHEDKRIKARLLHPSTLRGVLAWAVEGAQLWYAFWQTGAGLPTPQRMVELAQAQRDSQDFVQQFLNECYSRKEGAASKYSDVYKRYEGWCGDNGVQPKHKKAFTQAIERKGIQTRPMRMGLSTGVYVLGIEEKP